MTALTIDRINKRYGDLHILKDISVPIGKGEFISLLGPSGCGKTTTLRCIAGFERPDSGRILFGDRDVTRALPEHRDIGMVFQSYALFPHMTVAENLAFGLEARKVAPAERKRRIAEVLSMVRLQGYEARFPRELSGGQQQRVALARALVIEPSVLLLDEPLANLDATLRDEMRFFIRDLQQRVGITSIYVTHDQSEAMVMSDKIVVMNGGVISQFGSPRDIYERPASQTVAGFIGRSNTIAGTITETLGADSYKVETSCGTIGTHGPSGLARGADVRVMIRPENIRTGRHGEAADAPASDENILGGSVVSATYQGNATQLQVRMASGDGMVVDVSGRDSLAVGDQVTLRFSSRNAWLLAS
ncbi:putative spermidine/putrescine transport system ATP-binding protein [Pseudaminobacter salicylatoxidans]|uniref:Putative spermidine/putrescine transport system ATP-binding protein n=1 Tax=Pseudaminobacter salicylatoxidans TaxID=93369 RepID=A0A316C1E2_PSESE|nr:ABC transporter ATP-binding protein [Pseudaminobacter salicylatoxidans]PWJ82273.1 putative spermidine/putrescine transport system ATP-binding protein [Pseudaminobacter salicylatoxidans]